MRIALSGISMIAITAFMSSGATAQTAPAPSATASDVESPGDIVVTARKRNESIQNVPIAITAFDSAALDRKQARSLDDLSFGAPNIAITKNQTTSNSAQIYIRGIGQDDSSPTNEPGVGVYIDDVYLARSQGALLDLIDIERVEVLRGPQGTLYGRNSTGGAIKLITRRPDLTSPSFLGDATIGSFGRLDIRASVSVPIVTDTLAIKLDALTLNRNGYVTRLRDGADINRVERQGYRGSLLWQIAPGASLYVTADYSRDRSGQTAPSPLAIPPAGVGPVLPGNRQPLFGYYVSDPNAPDLYNYDGGGVSASLAIDTGIGQLKSVTAYRKFHNVFWSDLRGRSATSGGGTDLNRDLHQNQFTQELQLASSGGGALNYVVGAFYLREKIENHDIFLRDHNYAQTTDSIAGYADLSYDIARGLSVTAGGRYTSDAKTISETATTLVGTFAISDFRKRFNQFTPKLGLSYKPSKDLLLYASWQKGFKAGAFQAFPQRITDITDQTLAPERVVSYEGGFKATLFKGAVQFNGTAFYLDYQDIQLALLDSGLNFVARTAGARAWGTEFEAYARLGGGFSVDATLGTFDSKINRVNTADPLTAALFGTRIKHVPRFNAQISPSYETDLGNGHAFFIGGTARYVSSIYFDAANTPYAFQKGHEVVDGFVGVKLANDKARITLGVQNATDVRYALTATAAGQGSLFPAPPRTWSLSFRSKL